MKKIIFKDLFRKLKIKKSETILISSDILKILLRKKKKEIDFNLNEFIDSLIDHIGPKGTILFPTYSWEFCKKKKFDYKKTMSISGALSNFVLKRNDFKRTINPIYSFAVKGKDKNKVCKIKHKSCFGLDSPFGYLIKKDALNLYVDIENIYEDSFTLCHVAEEKVGVNYRYLKTFRGICKFNNKLPKKVSFKMNVRKLNLNIKTGVSPLIKKELINKKAYFEKNLNKINFKIVKMKTAYEIMVNDIQNNGNLIFKKKHKN